LRDALELRELRAERGVTQVELAERLGRSQGNVSAFERRDDVYLSSLREYVEALGGRLEIEAVFDDERPPIAIGTGD
jgi:transcriptional regulator with XRE-family HTH domain